MFCLIFLVGHIALVTELMARLGIELHPSANMSKDVIRVDYGSRLWKKLILLSAAIMSMLFVIVGEVKLM
jgi:hypothetical protein